VVALQLIVSDDDIFEVLGDFLAAIVPVTDVIQAQGNRVPEPSADDYVLMIPIRRERISTNVDSFQDDAYVGSIAAGVLTVTQVLAGVVATGQIPAAYPALLTGTTVGMQLSGTPGGVGTYAIAPAQTVASTILQAGFGSYLQPTKIIIQLEVHGPHSADNSQIISTMMRDDFSYDAFVGANPNVTPLYAEDPRQMPFSNDQQQVENRWVIECAVQANITVQAPQQFAGTVDVGLKPIL
jgi:hypothetical protein